MKALTTKQQTIVNSILSSGYTIFNADYDMIIFTAIKDGLYYLRTLSGRSSKVRNNYYFKTKERFEKYVSDLIESSKKSFEKEQEIKLTKKNFKHSAVVGTIFYSSWGYEQTNVDFYQVVEIKGKSTLVLKEITQSRVEGSEGNDCCNVIANKDGFKDVEPFKARITYGNSIKLTSYSRASIWNGKPKYKSWYY